MLYHIHLFFSFGKLWQLFGRGEEERTRKRRKILFLRRRRKCHHSGTNEQRTRKDRATQPKDHGRQRRAIYLLSVFSGSFSLIFYLCQLSLIISAVQSLSHMSLSHVIYLHYGFCTNFVLDKSKKHFEELWRLSCLSVSKSIPKMHRKC